MRTIKHASHTIARKNALSSIVRPCTVQHSDDVYGDMNYTDPFTEDQFKWALSTFPVVVVNFYAPWCPWCQRLEPTWQALMEATHAKYDEKTDGRIRVGKVDCTVTPVRFLTAGFACGPRQGQNNRDQALIEAWLVCRTCARRSLLRAFQRFACTARARTTSWCTAFTSTSRTTGTARRAR